MVHQAIFSQTVAELKDLENKASQFTGNLSVAELSMKGEIEGDIERAKIIKNISKSKRGGEALNAFFSDHGEIRFINMLDRPFSSQEKEDKQMAQLEQENNHPVILMDPTNLSAIEKTEQVVECLRPYDFSSHKADFVKAVQGDIAQYDLWKEMLYTKQNIEERHLLAVEKNYEKRTPVSIKNMGMPEPN